MAKTMSVSEASREFGLSASLIYTSVNRGEIPGVTRLGNRIILNRKRLEEFLTTGNQQGAEMPSAEVPAEPVEPVESVEPVEPEEAVQKRRGAAMKKIHPNLITKIKELRARGMGRRAIFKELGGTLRPGNAGPAPERLKRVVNHPVHGSYVMPSFKTVERYSKEYDQQVARIDGLTGAGVAVTAPKKRRGRRPANPVVTSAKKENTTTVQQETNDINRHRITIGNTFDCVNCEERFQKNYRLILTAMQGLKPKSDREESRGNHTGDPRLTSYALCGASCLIEFTTKKEKEQWILTPLRSKVDLEETPPVAPTETLKTAGLWRRFRNLAGGNE